MSEANTPDGEIASIKPSDIRRAAMDLLARREHSYRELQRKLVARFADAQLVRVELEKLRDERLQSDERFAESYLHSRAQRLYGPLRIRLELRERGIDESLIAAVMAQSGIDWQANLQALVRSKFGHAAPSDIKEKAKRQRFLQYRGFVGDGTRSMFD